MKKLMIISFAAILFSIVTGCEPTTTGGGEEPTNSITLNKNTSNINILKMDTLVATLKFNSAEPLVWSSSDEKIATVFYGIVTGKYPGTCNITATCGNLSATCVVNVFPSGVDPNDPDPKDDIDDYTLIWSDEFNGTTLNGNVWNIEVNSNGGGNNELQYYTNRPQNVRIGIDPETGESCLILSAIKESYTQNGTTRTCTSGRVNTKNNLTFKYGLIEARIKIPYTADGLWPAFWMMGNTGGWPKCGEIDIMEMGSSGGIRNGTQDRYFNGAIHFGQSWPQRSIVRSFTSSYPIQGSYHTFRLYWTPESLTMYLDKDVYPNVQPYFNVGITASENTDNQGYYFHKPNFILFNLAIGGDFTGINNISNVTALNAENNNTANFYIDYVRIYQKNGGNEDFWQK